MAYCSDPMAAGLSPPPYEAVVPYPTLPPPGGAVAEEKSQPLPPEATKGTEVNNQERQPILANQTQPPLQEYYHEVQEAVPSTSVALDNPSFLCRKRKTFLVKMYCATFITFIVLLFIVSSALSEGMKDNDLDDNKFNNTDINNTMTLDSSNIGNNSESQIESLFIVDDIQ